MNPKGLCNNNPWLLLAATAVVLSGLPGLAPATVPTNRPTGVWMWDDGRAGVQFHPCGEAFCGRIVWLKAEAGPRASPVLDTKNPDIALRGRRVCGLDYITGVKFTEAGRSKGGRVYDFNGGATYDLDVDSVDDKQVKMRGYKGIRMLGATLILVRAPADLSLCQF